MIQTDESTFEIEPVAGSTLYYVSRYFPSHIRPELLLLHKLHQEIRQIPLISDDPGVVRIKLGWWHEEIERLHRHAARHPLTTRLQEASQPERINQSLIALLNACDRLLDREVLATESDWQAWVDNGAGNIWLLTAELCQSITPQNKPTLEKLIRFSVWVDLLQLSYPLLRRGQCVIPDEKLQHCSLNREQIIENPQCSEFAAFLLHEYKRTWQRLDECLHRLRQQAGANLLPIIIFARLNQALCREIFDASNFDVSSKYALTPLRRAWNSGVTALSYRFLFRQQ